MPIYTAKLHCVMPRSSSVPTNMTLNEEAGYSAVPLQLKGHV